RVATPRDRIGNRTAGILERETVAAIAEGAPDAAAEDYKALVKVWRGRAEAIRSSYDDEGTRCECVCGQRVVAAVVRERPVLQVDGLVTGVVEFDPLAARVGAAVVWIVEDFVDDDMRIARYREVVCSGCAAGLCFGGSWLASCRVRSDDVRTG